MEFNLRCNALKCRKELNDHAVVTTCSHVFCIECSNQSQLSGSSREGRRATCPACDMHLPNPDDVVITNLNPSEDYKTSVLSGLSPNIIMECAGRALSFWAYQTTQEIVYQEYLAKSLTDKYATLNTQMDKIIHDANSEISNLRNKMIAMSADQDALRRKNEELAQNLRDKNRKLLQTQELYDKMKRRGMLDQVQNAASDAVDDTIQATVAGGGFANSDNGHHPRPQAALYTNQQNRLSHQSGGFKNTSMQPPEAPRRRSSDWPAFSSQMNHQNQLQQTPSSHRQPLGTGSLPNSRAGMSNIQSNQTSTTLLPQTVSGRSPLSNFNIANGQPPGLGAYGMRAGLKVGNPGTPVTTGFGRPIVRSVAQRSVSNLPFTRDSGLGTPSIHRGGYY
ncbi:hypothetical protein ACMFMG_005419 [Clarireedia jacksonii]